jgi:Tfp pilus assembly protein PilF
MQDAPAPSSSLAARLAAARRLVAARGFREAHALCVRALADDPACAEAYFLIAMIAAEHENFAKAAEVLDRALALAPDEARYHAQRGKCLARLGRVEEARRAAEGAAAREPGDALTLDTIGVVLSHAGDHARAANFFERAAALDRDNANIWHNLGVSRQFAGDFAGAEQAFEAELALQPEARRPYAALVNLRKQTRERNFIAELEAQFAAAEGDANARLSIGHALAKSYEDIGEELRAFEWLLRGKAAKRAALGDVIERQRALFAAADAPLRAPPAPGCPSEAPIFVVGMPRTGTTLVDRILSSHPAVTSAGELGHFTALALQRAGLGAESEEQMFAAAFDFAALGEGYIEAASTIAGVTPRFIDKMPINFLYAALIHRALPNARIICLRRGAMDACLSNFRQMFGTEAWRYWYALSLENTARYYALFDRLAARWREDLPAARYTEVRYEALVADLETETRRLLAFCGLDWDARCLSFHENAAPVATASSVQVRSPIYASSVGRWRRYGEALAPLRAALEAEGVPLE